MHSHRVLIVKAGNPKKIHSPNQLKGLVVAVQTGTKYEEYLKALKAKIGFTLQSYPGDNDAVAQVLLGRADAVLTQDTSFAFQAKAASGQDRGRLHVRGERPVRHLLPQGRRSRARRADQGRRRAAAVTGTLAKLAAKYKIPVKTSSSGRELLATSTHLFW